MQQRAKRKLEMDQLPAHQFQRHELLNTHTVKQYDCV